MSKQKAGKEIIRLIADFLQGGPIIVNHFEFPRLSLPNIAGYKPRDYWEIGGLIRAAEKVHVYIDEGAIDGATAFYQPLPNRLNLTPRTAKLNTPEHWSTVVHEATHMIQDKKKWRMSLAEMEADAHFAQALFMHHKRASFGGGLLHVFATAAEEFAGGNKKAFKNRIGEMQLRVNTKYRDQPGYENMHKKTRQDGI